jgi:hypothetical protein
MTPGNTTSFTLSPIPPEAFVGRVEETKGVLRRALEKSPPLQSVEGPSKIGRTSMLWHLQAISRGEEVERYGIRSSSIVAPYVDLTTRLPDELSAEELIFEEIAKELARRELATPRSTRGPDAMADVAATLKRLVIERHTILLLVDRVEHLLAIQGDAAGERWARSGISALGELNERVKLGVVLGFGATGPAKILPADTRRLHMIEALGALSDVLNRGNAMPTLLAELDVAEVREFTERARVPGAEGELRRLDREEIDWIADLAGGHPLIMQNVGIRLVDATHRGGDPLLRRSEIERELAAGLQGFMVDAFRRIGPFGREVRKELGELAAGETVDFPIELAMSLTEEGLARPVSSKGKALRMRSRGLRMALRLYLESLDRGRTASRTGAKSPPEPRVQGPSLTLAGTTDGPTLHLTRSEYALMKALVEAKADEVVSRQALKAILGADANDSRLTQRISVLRKKMVRTFGAGESIDSFYGEGYRLNEPGRFVLLDR